MLEASELLGGIKVEKMGNPKQKAIIKVSEGNTMEIYTHDEYGFAIDPKVWAQERIRDCCHGRGFYWKKVDRQETLTDLEGKKYSVKKPHDEMHPCGCALNRYQKFRENAEKRLLAANARGEDPAAELMRIHAEFGHVVKIESQQTNAEPSLIQVVSK